VIAFVIAAAVMAALALAWVVVPLLRQRNFATVLRERTNLAILRDQRRELERDLANGTVTSDQYGVAAAELDRRVLEETQSAGPGPATTPARSGKLTAALIGVGLPIVAAALYMLLGTPAALSPEIAQRTAPGQAAGDEPHPIAPDELDNMLERLAQRLQQEPTNAEGWAVLARSYAARGKPDLAVKAYERAAALVPNDATLLADYADTLALVQGRSLAGKPMQLIGQALKADPTQWKALALAGTASFDAKDYRKAVEYWERAKQSIPPTSSLAQSIEGSIAEARELGKLGPPPAPTAVAGAATTVPPMPPNAPNPSAKASPGAPPAGVATPPAAAPSVATVAGTVTLAPDLAKSAKPDDMVFIFARAAQGSRAPLALVRKQVKDLPATFTLDDSQAMSPQMTLSTATEVVVGARISKTGNAMPQSGDLEGLSPPVRLGTKGLALVIDRTLP
jgi:cytochrome c-type biogenesis protein CcmH